MRGFLCLVALSILIGACGATTLVPDTAGSYRSFPRTARLPKTCRLTVTGPEFVPLHTPFVSFRLNLREEVERALVEGLKQTCAATEPVRWPGTASDRPVDPSSEIRVSVDVRWPSLKLGSSQFSEHEFRMHSSVEFERSPSEEPLATTVEAHSAQSANAGDLNSLVSLGLKDLADQINGLIFENRERLARTVDAQ